MGTKKPLTNANGNIVLKLTNADGHVLKLTNANVVPTPTNDPICVMSRGRHFMQMH